MEYYLVVSTIMMFVGIYGFVTRRNLLAMLISVELILNSVDINFVVFNRFLFPGQLEGFFFALFAIGVSAAETAVAIAIIINIYRNLRHIQVKTNIFATFIHITKRRILCIKSNSQGLTVGICINSHTRADTCCHQGTHHNRQHSFFHNIYPPEI